MTDTTPRVLSEKKLEDYERTLREDLFAAGLTWSASHVLEIIASHRAITAERDALLAERDRKMTLVSCSRCSKGWRWREMAKVVDDANPENGTLICPECAGDLIAMLRGARVELQKQVEMVRDERDQHHWDAISRDQTIEKLRGEAVRYRTALEQIAATPPGPDLWQVSEIARTALDGEEGVDG